MKRIYRKRMKKHNTDFFIFLQQLMGGGEILRSSGSGARQSVDFVRLLYIIRLYLSPICRRRRGIEYNFMLCIIALSCFFSGANQVRWWRLEYLMSFLPCAKSVTEKNNSRVDCAEADKKTVQAMRYEWWGFLAAGDLPCGAARNKLSGED